MNDHGVHMPLPERMDIKLPSYAQELDIYSIVMTNWITESTCKMGAN